MLWHWGVGRLRVVCHLIEEGEALLLWQPAPLQTHRGARPQQDRLVVALVEVDAAAVLRAEPRQQELGDLAVGVAGDLGVSREGARYT